MQTSDFEVTGTGPNFSIHRPRPYIDRFVQGYLDAAGPLPAPHARERCLAYVAANWPALEAAGEEPEAVGAAVCRMDMGIFQ